MWCTHQSRNHRKHLFSNPCFTSQQVCALQLQYCSSSFSNSLDRWPHRPARSATWLESLSHSMRAQLRCPSLLSHLCSRLCLLGRCCCLAWCPGALSVRRAPATCQKILTSESRSPIGRRRRGRVTSSEETRMSGAVHGICNPQHRLPQVYTRRDSLRGPDRTTCCNRRIRA